MPLVIGCSKDAIRKNVRRLRREGYSRAQAVAIAYKIAREHRKMCKRRGHLEPKRKRKRKRSMFGIF